MFGPLLKQLGETLASVGALTVRTEDVAKGVHSMGEKVSALNEKVLRLEMSFEHLKANVRDSILMEVKLDLSRMQAENIRLAAENEALRAAFHAAEQPIQSTSRQRKPSIKD
jgi:regulator of replication initiation timing